MDRTDPWFDSLYQKYASKLVKAASLLLDNWAMAEEIVHDVFFILLLYREKVETYDNPGIWLYKVLYKRIGNELQRASRHRELPWTQEYEELAGDTDEFSRLDDVLPAGLSPEYRQILIWFYEDNLDCKEIGRRFHRTPHACETKLYRARNQCRDLLLKNKENV